MTHISDIADENTVKLDTDDAITVGQVREALSRFPDEAGVMIVFVDAGEFVGAVAHVDGVIANDQPDVATNIGLLLNIAADPIPATQYFGRKDAPTTPTPSTPTGFTPAS